MKNTFKIPNQIIKGNGSSLRGQSSDSYIINKVICDNDGFISFETKKNDIIANFTIDVKGKNIDWEQYTDNGIEKEISKNYYVYTAIQDYLENYLKKYCVISLTKCKITWSDQGMQSDKNWNFDVSVQFKVSDATFNLINLVFTNGLI